jgi:serine/threonine protein kinase HipA of HipAB toxin-antitoxin module
MWQRIDFNILVSNTDDHLRNYAFLYTGRDGWRLSPDYLALADQSMINQQEQLRFAGVVPQPYERFGAKLASLCPNQIHGSA